VKRRWRVTKGGWIVLATLVACGVVLTATTGWPRFLAGAVAGIILLALVGEGVSGFGDPNAEHDRKAEVLRRDRVGGRDDRSARR
jgi:hypothetical protein